MEEILESSSCVAVEERQAVVGLGTSQSLAFLRSSVQKAEAKAARSAFQGRFEHNGYASAETSRGSINRNRASMHAADAM
mmetsp:Transcript_5166/g.10246  ORF Transcript_5166/g.10246 Transcript_5166/m.10246 type:complete len:80 (+) Transcript_5166:169-408(+)